MGLKDIVIIGTLTSAFVLFLIGFMTLFAVENNSVDVIAQDAGLTSLNNTIFGNLTGYQADIVVGAKSFSNNTPTIGEGGVNLISTASVWQNYVIVPMQILKDTFNLVYATFGGATLVIGLIVSLASGIISIVAVLYAWKWIRSGDPD